MVAEELDRVNFKAMVDREWLAEETYHEVITKKNFYFQIDENKAKTNKRVTKALVSGNPHNKPHVILPHEHVHVTHYIDTEGLTEDKLFEIYGYYSLLVDLHIAQIRPDNLDEVSYIPRRYNQKAHLYETDTHLNNRFFEFYHRWREPTRTWFSQTQEINFQKTLQNRPHTHHYDHDRGSEY